MNAWQTCTLAFVLTSLLVWIPLLCCLALMKRKNAQARRIIFQHQRHALRPDRPRMRIARIGQVVGDPVCGYATEGFVFAQDPEHPAPGIQYLGDGQLLVGGYTRDELLEIAVRRAEFEP